MKYGLKSPGSSHKNNEGYYADDLSCPSSFCAVYTAANVCKTEYVQADMFTHDKLKTDTMTFSDSFLLL